MIVLSKLLESVDTEYFSCVHLMLLMWTAYSVLYSLLYTEYIVAWSFVEAGSAGMLFLIMLHKCHIPRHWHRHPREDPSRLAGHTYILARILGCRHVGRVGEDPREDVALVSWNAALIFWMTLSYCLSSQSLLVHLMRCKSMIWFYRMFIFFVDVTYFYMLLVPLQAM